MLFLTLLLNNTIEMYLDFINLKIIQQQHIIIIGNFVIIIIIVLWGYSY